MSKFRLAFGLHNHQPVGNFLAVFEEAHQRAYLPFLKLLQDHPGVALSLHQSGILWQWQRDAHPEYFELVGKLVDSNRLELLTGGYYEPIISSIPRRDAKAQINLLTEFLETHFGVVAKGSWLTERIWEPHLPSLLAESGVEFLPVDDTHFIYAGFQPSQLTGPMITEDQGNAVTLLPISKRLRYLIPFGTVDEVMTELKSMAEHDPDGMVIYADDGEKFGVWPNTYKHCYEDGWLNDLFTAIEKNNDWLQMVPLGQVTNDPPVGRAYLPTASYEEMLHWALPTEAFVEFEQFENFLKESGAQERYGRFARGGHWRGFLTKYPESNLMHKKVQAVSDKLHRAVKASPNLEAKLLPAYHKLYSAQCNCPYWHGVFGGLYLPHIRQAVNSNIIEAERLLEQLTGPSTPAIETVDFDLDGHSEIVYRDENYSAVVKPDQGGTLLDLSVYDGSFCLTDTLTRRKEGYHHKLDQAVKAGGQSGQSSIHDLVLAKEEGLSRLLVEDWYLKRCMIDHFFGLEIDQPDFASNKFREDGDFVLEPYSCQVDNSRHTAVLTREGMVRPPDGSFPVKIVKTYKFNPTTGSLGVTYALSSGDRAEHEVNFGVENNFNFQAGHAEDRYLMVDGVRPGNSFLDSTGSADNSQGIALVDEYRSLAVAVKADRPGDIWYQPIFTVSLSEGGFEKVYQGTTLLHRFRLKLNAEPIRLSFSVLMGRSQAVLAKAFELRVPVKNFS